MTRRIIEWFKDWVGLAKVESQAQGLQSPLGAIGQAIVLILAILSGPISQKIPKPPPDYIITIIRAALLLLLIFVANYIVVAKEEMEKVDGLIGTQSTKLVYKYNKLDRWVSKFLGILSLVLFVCLIFPAPKPCFISTELINKNDSGFHSDPAMYIEITGGGKTTQFPISRSGTSKIKVSPKQQKGWTLKVINSDGSMLCSMKHKGCINEKREYNIDENVSFVMRPR